MAEINRKQRGRGRPFQPGESGNPGGRPKEVGHVRELARTYTAEAIETLAEIMRDGSPDRARAAAAEALLNRGWGAPHQQVDVTSSGDRLLQSLTDDELIERLISKRIGPMIDVTPECET